MTSPAPKPTDNVPPPAPPPAPPTFDAPMQTVEDMRDRNIRAIDKMWDQVTSTGDQEDHGVIRRCATCFVGVGIGGLAVTPYYTNKVLKRHGYKFFPRFFGSFFAGFGVSMGLTWLASSYCQSQIDSLPDHSALKTELRRLETDLQDAAISVAEECEALQRRQREELQIRRARALLDEKKGPKEK